MSESLLIASTEKLTRQALAEVPTPQGTATHRPVAHIEVVETLIETLSFRHIGVVKEEYAVSKDGMKMFGVLDLDTGMPGCRFSIGIRNSHDRSMRLAAVVGLRVLVCENMAFSGDFQPVLAKHSKNFSLHNARYSALKTLDPAALKRRRPAVRFCPSPPRSRPVIRFHRIGRVIPMRFSIIVLAAALSAATASAQRFRIGEVNAETPEGKMLQQIGQESDEAKKLALMEDFAAKFPNEKALGWVWEQMQAGYMKANQPDKVMAVGEKLLAMDPQHAEAAHQGLKAAEAKKDPDLIKKWAGLTFQAADKVVTSPQPKAEDEVENWKKRVDWASQVKTYADYALFAALQGAPPQKQIELVEALEAQDPKSQYLPQAVPTLFYAYVQTKANDKALALAEKMLATDPSNEDMLLLVANSYFDGKREPAKVHAYCSKIVELMSSKPKPQGMSDADWETRKNRFLGAAHYISGKLYYTQNSFAAADKELRAALPLLADPQAKPEVLFYLGVANYKMEKVQEAANFNKECAATKSQFAASCSKNLVAIRSQYRGLR